MGRTVVWTKKSITRRIKLQSINYKLRTTTPAVVTSFSLVPFSTKLLTLVLYASGAQSYLPATSNVQIFSFLTMRGKRKCSSAVQKFAHSSLFYIAPMFRKVSNLELVPGRGIQYVRGAGCTAKIIKVNQNNHTALVKLPSGVRKFFSLYSSLYLGPSALKLKRKTSNTKSGY